MKAVVDDRVIAESDDIVENGGYHYFPPSAVRREWLEKAPRTASDLECPHGVQFYDVVSAVPGSTRCRPFAPRNAASVSASHGPATVRLQSWSAGVPFSEIWAPARSRIASPANQILRTQAASVIS
jgi:hypothetical protein